MDVLQQAVAVEDLQALVQLPQRVQVEVVLAYQQQKLVAMEHYGQDLQPRSLVSITLAPAAAVEALSAAATT
jgi:hypothetical protein